MEFSLTKNELLKLDFISKFFNASKQDVIIQMIHDTHTQILKTGYDTEIIKQWAQFVVSREGA